MINGNGRKKSVCRRRGATLVLFVMLLFAFLGMAALVIDLGFVRLTQRQMKTAANSAALEGLRGRDVLSDQQRRQNASDIVAVTFDDDLNPANGDPRNFGAGPVIDFGNGILLSPTFNASELLTISDAPVYKPTRSDGNRGLELNLDNLTHGDMVAGTYLRGAPLESTDYTRSDFQATGDTAFLVRLRRTRGDNALDSQPGVSSRGPVVPFLFGRGSLIDPDSRGRGVTVRATAIADARRAKSVGRAQPQSSLPGALPFVLYRDQWESHFPEDTAVSLAVEPNGSLTVETNDGPVPVGYVTDATAAGRETILGELRSSAAVADPASFIATVSGRASGYVPIVPSVTNTVIPNRVIGFGLLEPIGVNGGRLVVTKRVGRVAAENASPVLSRPLESIFSDAGTEPDAELESLFREHGELQGQLLAPTLVR